MQASSHLTVALVALMALTFVGCVDSGGFLNVDNQTDATYVAQVLDDEFRIIPPKTKLTVTSIGFVGDPDFEVRFFDADCMEVGTMARGPAVVVISEAGVTIDIEGSGAGQQLEMAQDTRFCSPNGLPTFVPTPTPGPYVAPSRSIEPTAAP